MENLTYELYRSDPNVRTQIERAARRARTEAIHRVVIVVKHWIERVQLELLPLQRATRAGATNAVVDAAPSAIERSGAVSIAIAQRKLVRIQDGRGVTLRVQQGGVWISQSGSTRDIYLEAGESFTIDRNGLTLVSNCSDALFAMVVLHAPRPASASLLEAWMLGLWSRRPDPYRFPVRLSASWV